MDPPTPLYNLRHWFRLAFLPLSAHVVSGPLRAPETPPSRRQVLSVLLKEKWIICAPQSPRHFEIRNSNNYRRLSKFSLFPVLFAVSVSTFGVLDFFRRFVGFFRRFVGFFRRFKTGKRMQHEKNAKSVRRQKHMPPAIIPEKALILHTLEDAGMNNVRIL